MPKTDVRSFGIGRGCQYLVLVDVADGGVVGEAGTHAEHAHLLGGVHVDVFADFGAWSYDAHLPFEDVEELRDLVDLEPAQECAHTGDARVVGAHGDQTAVVGLLIHGPELVELEIHIAASHSRLFVKHFPLRVTHNHQCYQNAERHANSECN